MKKVSFYILLFTVLYALPLSLLSSERTETISTGSAVTFNTLCSKCHEGECSGRLSFDTGSKTAGSHIRRYAEEHTLSKGKIKEFFALLNHMKKVCAIYMPKNAQWKQEDLSHFMLSSAKGYFIPLGLLEGGTYRMTIRTKEDIHFQTEVLSEHFDHFLNQEVCPRRKNNTLQFAIDTPKRVFLRIKSRKPLHILLLKIEKES
jgi:hypothetical protein